MNWRSTVMVALSVGAVAFTAGRVYSQDKKDGTAGAPSEDDMSAPAEQHKKLAALAGTWDCDMTMLEPGKEPKAEKGVTTSTAQMNGLYLSSEHKSTMGGKPFEGRAIDGYSKEKKKYFTFWYDQMGTTPMLMWGDADASGKTITYDGDAYDLGAMGQMTPRLVIKHEDADHFTSEFWAKMGGATDYAKWMEGKYTRRK